MSARDVKNNLSRLRKVMTQVNRAHPFPRAEQVNELIEDEFGSDIALDSAHKPRTALVQGGSVNG